MNPVVLITGGLGCIGAETTKWLLQNSDAKVVVSSRRVTKERAERVFGPVAQPALSCVEADITDADRMRNVLSEHRVTHVVHMAGLQTPDCNANRDLGLQVNLAGTQNLIESIKELNLDLERFLFASSMAVYGPRASYPAGRVAMSAPPNPVNVYGAWKQAAEHVCRFFCDDTGVPTLSVRPGVLYGPGRDAGLTAAPTTAMKHLAKGLPYEIPFTTSQDYLYAPDVGAAVGGALLEPFSGYGAFTLPSHTADSVRFVDAIRSSAVALGIEDQFAITIGNAEVPFMHDIDFQPFLDAFPKTPHTPLEQGVLESIRTFQSQL